MAADEFFGCLLTSFGVPLVLILYTVIFYPLRIITLIISASFWLVSLLLSSVLWFAVVPLRDKLAFGVVFSVIFQEMMRFAFIIFLHKIYNGIKMIMRDLQQDGDSVNSNNLAPGSNSELRDPVASLSQTAALPDCGQDGRHPLIADHNVDDIFNVTVFAYVGGLGFGLIAGLFATLTLLTDLRGPGTLGYYGQPRDFVTLYAVQTLLVVLNHVSFTVLASCSLQARSWPKMAAVLCLHLGYSLLSLANGTASPGPEAVLTANGVLCAGACLWAFLEAGGRCGRLPRAAGLTLRAWARDGRHFLGGGGSSLATGLPGTD